MARFGLGLSHLARTHSWSVSGTGHRTSSFRNLRAFRTAFISGRALILLGLLLLAMCFVQASLAQTITGLPAMAPLQGFGVDTVNEANLNLHIAIPLINKPGRKLPFSYLLNYDNTTWTPVQNSNGTWKWSPFFSLTTEEGRPFPGPI